MASRPIVVIAEQIARSGIEVLEREVDVVEAVGVDRDELLAKLGPAAGLIVRSATDVDAELLAAAPRLVVVGRAGIGVDNIDLAAATASGVLVVNAPEANTVSAAEHTMALLLAQARRVPEADGSLRQGAWERSRLKGVELYGKTLGVVGLGKIGGLVAERAKAFGMRVIAHDPYVTEERARRAGVELVEFDQLLAESDFVTIHLPRTRDTEGLFGRDAFTKMKPGARVINVARGGIVDEGELSEAIADGTIAGAALDVFAVEPPERSSLMDLREVVLTPHLGASTVEAQDKAGVSVAEAVAAALRGELIPHAVNVDFGGKIDDAVAAYMPLAEALGAVFVGYAHGLGSSIELEVRGALADAVVHPLAIAVTKGVLGAVSGDPVTFVNATERAELHGLEIVETVRSHSADYATELRLTGEVGGVHRAIAGTVLERKGPVLTTVEEYVIELPLSRFLLLLRNDDVPGVIGRVGTYLGEIGVNIADMAVGRAPSGNDAMMGLHLDQALPAGGAEGLAAIDGVAAVRYIELPVALLA